MAERDREATPPGSWDISGTESQRIMRLDDELPVVTAIQRSEDRASAAAEKGVEELLDTGELGRAANWA
jgi:hypothetical protein